jgi:hypothetical protein
MHFHRFYSFEKDQISIHGKGRSRLQICLHYQFDFMVDLLPNEEVTNRDLTISFLCLLRFLLEF